MRIEQEMYYKYSTYREVFKCMYLFDIPEGKRLNQ